MVFVGCVTADTSNQVKDKTTAKNPKRLSRAESFFGLHFDFHAGRDCSQIGKDVTPEMIENIIIAAKPDYIQCDCKGHAGISSYPTKVGNPAPGFVKDQLRIWRDVTAKYGVALYMHYSGVLDTAAVKAHPDWARIRPDGKADTQETSVFGPYVDGLLIPQLKELCDVYGVDGVWVDGECWATERDYCDKAVEAFQNQTGIKNIPRKPEDPCYFEYTQFCREAFRRYVNHYVDVLHKHNPNFQVASNWLYSSFVPERITIPVDFISGDYSMSNSVNVARLEARCMVHQNKPWDLMAWSFCSRWSEYPCVSQKTAVQLQREAAVVLAQGGGFQAYFKQKRDGSITEYQVPLMRDVANFCRARQKYCHNAEPVPQVGLIYSSNSYYRNNTMLFKPDNDILEPMRGVLICMLDSQYSIDILMDHHILDGITKYPLIVVPEWHDLSSEVRDALLAYTKSGGNLLVIGPSAAAQFEKQLRVKLTDKAKKKNNWLEQDNWLAALQTVSQPVELGEGAEPFGGIFAGNDIKGDSTPAASIAKFGKGKIAGVYINLGQRYCRAETSTHRKFIAALVAKLFPEPIVELTGSHLVEVVVKKLDGKLMINLINTAGPHGDENVYVFDEIPPVGPLEVKIRVDKKPKSITLQPEGTKLHVSFSKNQAKVTVPKLDIHSILVVDLL